jgi:hypothetical protein
MRRSVQLFRILAMSVAFLVRGFFPDPGRVLAQPTTYPLLQPSDLVYLGAFRLPPGSTDQTSFSYGGMALAYNPAQNSLFLVGHDWYQRTAEVTIPTIVNSSSLSALSTATFLQPFTDATNGEINQTGGSNNKIGGQLIYQGRLYGTAYIYYDAGGSQVVSHWVRPSTSLSSGSASGLYQVGGLGAGFVSGYMTQIPAAWQSAFGGPALTGNCCLSIISRTSYGPAAFVFNPTDLGAKNPVPATPLVYYPSTNPTLGAWNASWNPSAGILFNGTTTIRAIIFPHNSSSVLFIGRQGVGTFCYGTGGASGGDCYDPDDSSKGTHAYPYAAMVWAYHVNDLLAAKNGQKQPWNVKPYATWTLTLPFGSTTIGGATYDPTTGNIYVSQQYGNGVDPVIHILTVKASASIGSLSSPTNLRVIP